MSCGVCGRASTIEPCGPCSVWAHNEGYANYIRTLLRVQTRAVGRWIANLESSPVDFRSIGEVQ